MNEELKTRLMHTNTSIFLHMVVILCLGASCRSWVYNPWAILLQFRVHAIGAFYPRLPMLFPMIYWVF